MSAAALQAPLLPRERRTCPHTPPCPTSGRGAMPVDRRPEHGWTLLCNGSVLFDDGTFVPLPTSSEIRPLRVLLRVWGETEAEAKDAEIHARRDPRARLWEIVEVVATVGGPCPIRRGDPLAVGQHAVYGSAWGAYPAAFETGESGRES